MMQKVFNFFGIASSAVIFLVTSLEAFLNQTIPDEFEYRKIEKRRTEIYNKEQIQKSFNIKEKFSKILPLSLGMNEIKTNQKLYKGISDFVSLRNELIHTKDEQGAFKYQNFSGNLLNHDYNKSIITVRDAINHFKPNYIMECDCGEDF